MKVCIAAVHEEHMGYLRHLTPWLESKGHEVREKRSSAKYDDLGEADVFIVWNGTEMEKKPDGILLYAEVGWFPGAPLPGSAVNMYVDRCGINAASELVSLSRLDGRVAHDFLQDGQVLFTEIGVRPVVGVYHKSDYTFVPLQVDDDSNVRLHGRGWTAQKLITRCEQTVDGRLIFKRHPRDKKEYKVTRGVMVTDGDIWGWMLPAKRIIGINSTALLQAWVVGKEVVVYGDTFWASCARRAWMLYELVRHRQIRFAYMMHDADQNHVLQEVFP